jgi:twitching motility protein PilT
MNSIFGLIEYVKSKKANEILVHSGKPAQMRLGKSIVPMPGRSADPQAIVSEILNDEEKTQLFEKLQIQGSRVLDKVSFKFDFQIDFEGMSGSIELENKTSSLWQVPGLLIDGIVRGQGLNLICGPKKSGKTNMIKSLIGAIENKGKLIAIYGDEEILGVSNTGNMISQLSIDQLKQNGPLASADIIVLDSSKELLCEEALDLSERGYCVVMTLPYLYLQMGLQRFMDHCQGSSSSRARRLAMILKSAVGTRLVPGIESPLQGAYEFLLANSELQKNLLNWAGQSETLPTFEKSMQNTLNQSLFQLLIKRKIEIKAAFDASPLPEELDLMLKKVGI